MEVGNGVHSVVYVMLKIERKIVSIVKKTRKVFIAALYGDLVFAFLSISFGTAEKKKQSPY